MLGLILGAVGIFFLLGILGATFAFLKPRKPAISPSPVATAAWSDDDSPIPVSANDPMWGAREAPVTLVIFSDFQCPFCSRLVPTLDQVKSQYGPQKLRIIWKNQPLPFHDKAKPAAEAAHTVFLLKGSDGFWKFHDTAFKNQTNLNSDSYEMWAALAGADRSAFRTELARGGAARKVDEDMALGKKVGANGTPTAFVNGILVSGAQPFDKWKQVIDGELSKASSKMAMGTSGTRIYVERSKENFAPSKTKDDDDEQRDDKTVWNIPVGTSPVLGRPDAIVTIVEFSDFQCPYCKHVEDTLKKVVDRYGSRVRIVWKNEPLPFHPRAEPAAEMALEARAQRGDKAFWEAHDKLFESQPKLDDADLLGIAGDMQLDVRRVKTAITTKKYGKEVEADTELGDDVQASGTPHFFVNGRRLVGAQPFEKFQTLIDEELKKYEISGGAVPPRDWYAHIMREAKGPNPPEKKTPPTVPAGAPWKGTVGASVVIQLFSDFQCPFCARLEPTMAEVMKNYGDRVKLVWRDKPLPMHVDAPLAAEAAREAQRQKGSEGFWAIHDKMFANQQRLKRDDLEVMAQDLGLDMTKFRGALDDHTHKPTVDTDDKAGTEAGVNGTPSVFVNGYFVNGAQPYAKFKKAIDLALAEAVGGGGVRLGGTNDAPGVKSPTLRQGAMQVNGRLPPEVIQRIVRQNFGRFRLCYENSLRSNPKLQGRVAVKFVIDRSGAVSTASDGGSDLPDQAVVSCVVRGFGNLSFPQPEGGIVVVNYPIIFSPGD